MKLDVLKCSQAFLRSQNYSFVAFGGLNGIFVYALAAQTSAGQAGPKFKTIPPKGMKE